MSKRTKLSMAAAAAAIALALGGAAVVQAGGEAEGTVTGTQADKATAAALAITKGGKANAVERDSENGATWEVEVTKTGGTTVDVRLDASYGLVVVESDSETDDSETDDNETE